MTRARWIAAMVALVVASAAAAATAWYFFAPAPPGVGGFAFVRSVPGARATIWAVGDGDASAASRALVARISAGHPDRFLYLGDVYARGTHDDFREHYAPTWGRLASITAPTPGNHDWPRHRSGYDPYWRRALGRSRTAAWYAFRAAGWTILSIDSEADHGDGSAQLAWLRSKLRARGTCRIAFWHRPRFSAGSHHGDTEAMAPVWDALRGHATIVVSGHEHDMQRLHPIDAITQFVSGAGGHSHHGLRRGDARLAFGDDRLGGALRLRLRRGVAAYAFVSTAGRVLDRGTLRCRPLRARGSYASAAAPAALRPMRVHESGAASAPSSKRSSTSVPPPSAARISQRSASWAISASPSPSPGLSVRGPIPTPVSRIASTRPKPSRRTLT
ncbi:MAG: hypothetical protein QOG94_663 [Solirubrobacteraceae bacterium]|nr:hypothetical protein [Solirubrobacteraceae bacterium]